MLRLFLRLGLERQRMPRFLLLLSLLAFSNLASAQTGSGKDVDITAPDN
jgi:hypothetical protein